MELPTPGRPLHSCHGTTSVKLPSRATNCNSEQTNSRWKQHGTVVTRTSRAKEPKRDRWLTAMTSQYHLNTNTHTVSAPSQRDCMASTSIVVQQGQNEATCTHLHTRAPPPSTTGISCGTWATHHVLNPIGGVRATFHAPDVVVSPSSTQNPSWMDIVVVAEVCAAKSI